MRFARILLFRKKSIKVPLFQQTLIVRPIRQSVCIFVLSLYSDISNDELMKVKKKNRNTEGELKVYVVALKYRKNV